MIILHMLNLVLSGWGTQCDVIFACRRILGTLRFSLACLLAFTKLFASLLSHVVWEASRVTSWTLKTMKERNLCSHSNSCVVTFRMKLLIFSSTLSLSILQHDQNLYYTKCLNVFCFFFPLGRVWSYGSFSVVWLRGWYGASKKNYHPGKK